MKDVDPFSQSGQQTTEAGQLSSFQLLLIHPGLKSSIVLNLVQLVQFLKLPSDKISFPLVLEDSCNLLKCSGISVLFALVEC